MTTFELYKLFTQYPKVSTDTRKDIRDSIFFCLRGENFNGNKFAEQAIDKNVAFVVIDDQAFCKEDERYILVDDTLKMLQNLAICHRSQLKIPFIGLTGSNGKTTTKELITAVLSKKYKTASTQGNLNNHIGVPLTILSINKNHEIVVIEMGANHKGEIKKLCEIADPDYGLITNIGKAHLGGFGTLEGVIKAKSELYDYIKKKQARVFVNYDNELLLDLSEEISRITYGNNSNAQCRGKILNTSPFLFIEWYSKNQTIPIDTNLFGNYNFENVLAAICTGDFFSVKPDKIQSAVESYKPANNRSQIIDSEKNKLIMDAYNANPTSMSNSIREFAEKDFENKLLIIGDMLELGKQSREEHTTIIELIQKHAFEKVYLVGSVFSSLKVPISWKTFVNVDVAKEYIKEQPIENATVFIKGSRGIQLEKLLELL